MNLTSTQNTQNHNNVNSVNNPKASAPNPQPLTGDAALMKAMLTQILELDQLTTAAASESDLSVAMRKSLQNSSTERIEEIEKLMEFASNCEGGKNWSTLYNAIMGSGGANLTFDQLQKMFPQYDFSSVPEDMRDDFVQKLKDLIQTNPDPKDQSEFRQKVSTLSTMLQQYGTFQSASKNLADGLQNGAGSLVQSITQFLAQLATESGLIGDVVAQ